MNTTDPKKKLMGPGLQQGLSAASGIMGAMSNMSGGISGEAAAAREGIRGAIGQMGPWGAAISAATGAVDMISDMAGISINTLDQGIAERAGMGGVNKLNTAMASIPGLSFLGALTGKTQEAEKSAYIDQMIGGYSGSVQDIDAAQEMGGKRMFGKNQADKFILQQNAANALITEIAKESEIAKNNNTAELYNAQNQNKYAGYSPKLLLAKNGEKMPELNAARDILKRLNDKKAKTLDINAWLMDYNSLFNPNSVQNSVSSVVRLAADSKDGIQPKDISQLTKNVLYDVDGSKEAIAMKLWEDIQNNKEQFISALKSLGREDVVEHLDSADYATSLHTIAEALSLPKNDEPKKFQLGGKINLIPDGALHKNKHHLEDVNSELEGKITEKGIPVVVLDDSDDVVEQTAEIEKNEIIFAHPVTVKLEELFAKWKETQDDSIAIECGKFLTEQILRNTDDQTGLREEVGNV